MNDLNDKEIEGLKVIDTKEKAEVELKPKKIKNKLTKDLLTYVFLIIIAFGLAQIIHKYVFTPVTVSGPSMETTIYNNDQILLSRIGKIHRFDVVVFNVPGNERYIKRVIGLPGDDVEMINYNLYINGKKIDEPFLNNNPFYTGMSYANGVKTSFTLESICAINNNNCMIDGKLQIPKGYYLVLGDNRNNSTDSRVIGLVPANKVIGKALFVFYPFNRFGKTFG